MSILTMRDGYTSEASYFVCDLPTCSLIKPAEQNGTNDQQGNPNRILPKGWCVPNDANEAPNGAPVRPVYCCVGHWLEHSGRSQEHADGIKQKPVDITLARELPELVSARS